MRSRQQPLSKFKHVALRRETWHGPRRSRTVYTVRLATHGDPVLVDSFRAYPDARRLAEELSVFCELKLSDDTSGKMVVREHGTLDWSLRQRQQDRRAETGRRKRPDSPLSKYPCNAVAESQTADADELEELTVTDRGIIARSDDQTIAFGADLPVHELEQIHAELLAILG